MSGVKPWGQEGESEVNQTLRFGSLSEWRFVIVNRSGSGRLRVKVLSDNRRSWLRVKVLYGSDNGWLRVKVLHGSRRGRLRVKVLSDSRSGRLRVKVLHGGGSGRLRMWMAAVGTGWSGQRLLPRRSLTL